MPHKPILLRTHRCQTQHRTAEAYVRCALGRVEWVMGSGPFAVIAYCPHGNDPAPPPTVTLHATLDAARASIETIDASGCGGRCGRLHEIRRIPIDEAPARHGEACSYCGSPDGLERCCPTHPWATICQHCRPGKPDRHRPPDPDQRTWVERGARLPPYSDRTVSLAGWVRYRELLDELGALKPRLFCDVCGSQMAAGQVHADCAAGRQLVDIDWVPPGPLLADPEGSAAWSAAAAEAAAGIARALAEAEPVMVPAVLDPLHGPWLPVDVSLDPEKAWTDWRTAIAEVFSESPRIPGHPGVQ